MSKTKIKIPSAYDMRPDATGCIRVTLPILPPSTNALFANVPGKGRVKTREYRRWIADATLLLNAQCKDRMVGPASLSILLENKHPRRDASNTIKAIEDLLVSVGILKDDSAAHVRSVSATWADVEGLNIQVWRALA